MIKKFNQVFSAIVAACVILTSVPVNALSTGETNTVGAEHTLTEQQTLNDLNTENSISTNESSATSAEVATDSNAKEDTSISDISSNDIEADALERMLSSEEKLNNEISLQNDETEDGEEPSTDNWELGLVFYDSTVDNGKTPLTEIDWDASDGGYGQGETRVVTVQINYKNTNAVTTYQPGELSILVPSLTYNTSSSADDSPQWESSVVVGANDSIHTGYDWNYNLEEGIYTFSNANLIEAESNFEGSIQLTYTITPKAERVTNNFMQYPDQIEIMEDSCIHEYSKDISALLKYNAESIYISNNINLGYKRTYTHPWEKKNYTVTKRAQKITSMDMFPSNASDYIWVKYLFTETGADRDFYDPKPCVSWEYPYNYAVPFYWQDSFPEGCVVYDSEMNRLEPFEGNTYKESWGEYNNDWKNSYVINSSISIYVGYPKSIYNEENDNLNIENTVSLVGTYYEDEEESLLAQGSCSLNLGEFDFIYSGNLYGITKGISSSSTMRQQDITGARKGTTNIKTWYLYPTAKYTGSPMTLKIGDDILYATDSSGKYTKLEDDEYYFSSIQWNPSSFVNGLGNIIEYEKYNCELYVRYGDSNDYVLFDSFKNPESKKEWTISKEDNVVGFYFMINDVCESVESKSLIYATTVFEKEDIPESGTLYNFDYLQVFFKDNEQNLILQNEPGLNSYANLITKEEIAQFDQNTYGTYMQRGTNYCRWAYYNVTNYPMKYYPSKTFETGHIKDTKNEKFYLTCSLSGCFYNVFRVNDFENLTAYGHDYDREYACKGFILYDLLPQGMQLESSEEDIKKSIQWHSGILFNEYFERISVDDLKKDSNVTVEIRENWNNTGRTFIKIVIEYPFPIYSWEEVNLSIYTKKVTAKYDVSVDFNSYLEYGSTWTNYGYMTPLDNQLHATINSGSVQDNGYYDKDASDINQNGNTSENISYSKAITTISDVVSSHQSLTKYVKTDKSNYSTGVVKASPNSEYTYKLCARTGGNRVTSFIIYDSIEEYVQDPYSVEQNFITAYGTKKHWNGEFLGIDTSYAESKGYVVKSYYSENKLAGNLYNEDSSLNADWKEYSDSIDKSKVKALAFEYLDTDGNKAVLPANSQTYVLVKMKAPPEENRKILAYNGCRTQWQALDDYDRPVDFITGINSNIVKVTLSDYFDLTVNKIWDDENNKWGLRPDSIDIILKKSGVEIERKQITADNLSVTFTDLLTDDAKFYTIEEEPSQNYKATIEYNELEDCYEITNTLKDDVFKDIEGTKTWVGDNESKRPESITIKLLKDGEVYRTTTTNADKDWKYSFEKVPIYNADETKCIYSVEEVPVDNYITQYDTDNNGLAITFNENFKTYSSSAYVQIYYQLDGKTYRLGSSYYGSSTYSLAGKTIYVPSTDFYLYWYVGTSSNNYYGFSIDDISPAVVDGVTGTSATLPSYTPIEVTGMEYPESEHIPHETSGTRKLWHYTSNNVLKENIINTYDCKDLDGTKIWVGDTETNRPESITINLLKDGKVYKTTTTTSEKEWKYIFEDIPIHNEDGSKCIYSVEEEPVEGYTTQYTGGESGLAITFNNQFETESVNYDYVEIYYKQDGQTFKLGKWGGTTLAGKTINVPTNDFYLYWRTDSSNCNYYGFSIDSIETADVNATGTVATLPNYTATEITGTDYPESPNHGNYGNNVKMLWHYTGSFISDVPAEGLFNIVNTYEGVDAVNLSFVKAIEGTDESWNNMKLDKNALYKFQVSMKNTETGDTISVQIDNKNTVTVREVPIGTYVITEKDDMYFDFVSMEALNNAEGITFEKVGDDYVLSITEDAAEEETLQIKVNNKIEPDRPYEDKEEKENLFNYSSNEEKASLLSKIANFFTN